MSPAHWILFHKSFESDTRNSSSSMKQVENMFALEGERLWCSSLRIALAKSLKSRIC